MPSPSVPSATRYGYQISRFSEQMDAIGSMTPASEVEPAGWKVMFTQVGSAILGAVGVLMALMSLFQP